MAKVTPLNCPNCKGTAYWQDPTDQRLRRCKSCGSEYSVEFEGRSATEPEELPEIPPEAQGSASTKSSIGEEIFMLLALMAVIAACIGLGWWVFDQETYDTNISVQGEYVIPNKLDCQGAPLAVEFGFRRDPKGPLLVVYPGIDGRDTWEVSPELEEEIDERNEQESVYLWVHCEDEDNLPEFYPPNFNIPDNGRRVVIDR